MSKKYIGKLKSFDKIIEKLSIDGFYTADYIKVLFENSGTEIELIDGYYKNCLLKKEWFLEIKEVEENEIWKPETDEEFVVINSRSQFIHVTQDNYNEIAKDNIKIYNYWKTQEEAETVEKSMKLYRAMKRWSFDNDNGYEFNLNKINWEILFNFENKKFEVLNVDRVNIAVVFSSKEKATQCLEWLKKEKLI